MAQLTIELPDELVTRLRAEAAQHGLTVEEYVAEDARRWIESLPRDPQL